MGTHLAVIVANYLQAQGLNPHSAQERLGVSDSTISNWLAGRSLPPATRIPALAAALGVTTAELRRIVANDRQAARQTS